MASFTLKCGCSGEAYIVDVGYGCSCCAGDGEYEITDISIDSPCDKHKE